MNIFETEFAAYISAKKSGQRKEAMKALNAFLEDCKKLDLDVERKVVADFFKVAGCGIVYGEEAQLIINGARRIRRQFIPQ